VNPQAILKDYQSNFSSKRKRQREEFTFWLRKTYVIMLWVMISLLIYYVWILNVSATRGYNIIELETEKRSLLLEKEILDVKIAELESLENILNTDDMKGMEQAWDPNFIVINSEQQYTYNY